jgi:hypothetical protein
MCSSRPLTCARMRHRPRDRTLRRRLGRPGSMPMSSTTMRSHRQMRATVRPMEASTLALAMVWVRVSRVNQATRRSFSMAASRRRHGRRHRPRRNRAHAHRDLRCPPPIGVRERARSRQRRPRRQDGLTSTDPDTPHVTPTGNGAPNRVRPTRRWWSRPQPRHTPNSSNRRHAPGLEPNLRDNVRSLIKWEKIGRRSLPRASLELPERT